MAIEFRTATPDDYESAVETISTAFLERGDAARVAAQLQGQWEPERTWLAVDGRTVAGTFRSWPTEITVPGLERLPAGAVAAVTVLPTHRRRGILTELASREHAAMRDRGEVFALLYAAEFPIYGRFGYGPGTRTATWTIDTTRTGLQPGPEPGTVELVRPDETTRDALRDMFDAWRRTNVAEIRRREFAWDYLLGLEVDAWDGPWKGWFALHRDSAGTLDGFLRYSAEQGRDANFSRTQLVVPDLFALTEAAERALWVHLLSSDLVASVRAAARSPADPIAWRVENPRAAVMSDVSDGLWVRVFDVPRALAARTYERPVALVLEVVDDVAAGGRWRVSLDGSPAGSTCTVTGRAPDLTIPVAALGSVYLGAHDLRDVALRTGADEHRPGALAEAAAAFRTLREPWCSTSF